MGEPRSVFRHAGFFQSDTGATGAQFEIACGCVERLRKDIHGRGRLIDLCGECKENFYRALGRYPGEADVLHD